jgi:hypothetical protein
MTDRPTPPPDPVVPPERTLDTKTVEVLALAVFRTMFRDGIRVPLKMKGKMDMDLVVRDSNVVLNMNQVQTDVPELAIWRITFAYHGKPVFEYGRGIKNDVKIHLPQAFVLLLAIWQERRRKNRAKARAGAAKEREMIAHALTDPKTGKQEETSG